MIELKSSDITWTEPGKAHPARDLIKKKYYGLADQCWIGDVYDDRLLDEKAFTVKGRFDGRLLRVKFMHVNPTPHHSFYGSSGWVTMDSRRRHPLYIYTHGSK